MVGKRIHLMLRAAGCLTAVAILYSFLPGFWSSIAWGQQSPTQLNAQPSTELNSRIAQAERARGPKPPPLPSPLVEPSAPNPTPIAMPAINPASALGSALLSCDKAAEGFEPVSLPGARGEIKLDRWYRGPEHIICSFNALLIEATLLLENYRKIVDAKYPELGSIDDVCRMKPDNLATDLQSATEFEERFNALKAEYGARANCVSRSKQLLRDVTFSDMAQAPTILNSMIAAIEGDIKEVSAAQAQLGEFAEKINSSH